MASATALEGFRPVHEAHAIEQLVVAIQFDRPLIDNDIRQIDILMASFSESLPGRNEIKGVGFQIGPHGMVPITQPFSDVPHGIVRTFTDPSGVVTKELRIERQSLVFRTMDYTRWASVWSEAQAYFTQILPRISSACIATYSLTYIDKYVWEGAVDRCRPALLLRSDSPYVAPTIFCASDLWHSHSGHFVADGKVKKRLVVVDIDCLDETDTNGPTAKTSRVVRISTALTAILNQPGFEPSTMLAQNAAKELESDFSSLHNSLKVVFGSIVNEVAANQVGLNKNAN